jgi:hypothetical protein
MLRTVSFVSPFAVVVFAVLTGCLGSSDESAGFRVISPNGGEVWKAGLPESVRWSSSAFSLSVTVQLSEDGGESWSVLASDIPDTGELDLVAPAMLSESCLVRVLDPASGEADDSDEPFAIVGGISITSPTGGEKLTVGDLATIRWDATGVDYVRIELSRDGGSSWEDIAAAAPGSAGIWPWTVEDGGLALPQDACVIRLSDVAGIEAPDESDELFRIWGGTWTYPGRIIARPGQIYTIRFADPVDGAAIDSEWLGLEVANTFLGPMFRPTVVLKADDLNTPLEPGFIELLDSMSARGLPVSCGLICETLLDATSEDVDLLSKVDPVLVEVFHHGYDHSHGDGWREFSGTGHDFQLEQLVAGMDLAQDVLGINLRTFGAPFNWTDADTVSALELVPELEVIFYQPVVDGRVTYPRPLDVEDSPGVVFNLVEFRERYHDSSYSDILAIQCHPAVLDEVNTAKLMEAIDFLAGEADRRFSAPTAYARWLVDREAVSLKKTEANNYELDFRDATYPQMLEFTVPPTSVTVK